MQSPKLLNHKLIPGYGPSISPLMIVAEAPGEWEEMKGIPLIGPTGEEVASLCNENGFSLDSCYRTNVVKVRPPDNKLFRLRELGLKVADFEELLWNEVNAIKPNAILALGELALNTLTGKKKITNWRGSILESLQGFPKVIPTIHPAAYLKRRGEGSFPYGTRAYISNDFSRAYEESKTKPLFLPDRNLLIARNSTDLYDYIYHWRKVEKATILSLDIEVIKSIPICVALAFSPKHAISVPLLNLQHIKGARLTPHGELASMWIMLAELFNDPEVQVIGQNFKFDRQKLNVFGLPIANFYADTNAAASIIYPEFPKSQEFLCSIYTREPFYKNEYREYDIKKDSFDRILLYNAKDAAICLEIFLQQIIEIEELGLTSFFFNYTIQLHAFYMQMEKNGIAVDKDKWAEIAKKYIALDESSSKELTTLIGHPFNVRSNPAVRTLIEKELHLPSRESYNEDNLVALISTANVQKDQTKATILDAIIKVRRIKRFISGTLLALEDYDDRMRTSVNIYSVETGRTSNSILNPPVRPEKIGWGFQTIPHRGIGEEIRKVLIPDPGKIFMNYDLSQVEPRIVATLSRDEFALNLWKEGKDVHRWTASIALSLPLDYCWKLAKDSPERFIGKVTRNGGNLGMGSKRFKDSTNADARKFGFPLTLKLREADDILKRFHKASPNIQGVFHKEVKELLFTQGTLINAFGRKRTFFDRKDEETAKQAYAWIVSSSAGDYFKIHMLEVWKKAPWIEFLMENHDACLVQIPIGKEKEAYELIMGCYKAPIDFSGCSLPRGILNIPVEFEVGDSYGTLQAYKG